MAGGGAASFSLLQRVGVNTARCGALGVATGKPHSFFRVQEVEKALEAYSVYFNSTGSTQSIRIV